MNDSDSTTSEDEKASYLDLLREIEKLENLSTNSKHSHYATEETLTMSEIETIFNNVNENIESISKQMAFQKRAMLIVSIFNIVLRLSAIDGFDLIISRPPFQSILRKVENLMDSILCNNDLSPTFRGDIADSMLMNLTKDNFIDKCFGRLLLNKPVSNIEMPTTQRCVEVQENQSIDTTTEESDEYDTTGFKGIVEVYLDYAEACLERSVIRSMHEFKKNYRPLMISMQTFIHHYLTNTDNELLSTLLNILMRTLSIIITLTDKVELISMFIDTGYVKESIEWIRSKIFVSPIGDLGLQLCFIVNNLSRDKIALKQLRMENAFDALMEHKEWVDKKNDNQLTEMFRTALIPLVDSDEQPEQNIKFILDTSKTLYQSCKKADQDPDLNLDGCHLSEYLELLHHAFANTYVIKHMLENENHESPSPLQYFQQLFLSFYGVLLDPEPDVLEKRVVECLLKILLQISNYSEYLQEFTANNQLCIIIESLANRPKFYGAKRIWYNIRHLISPDVTKKATSSMIYISYDWADQEFCKEFVNELRKRITIPICIDYENVESDDDVWEYSYENLTSATVVIALVSMAFSENTDKFQELAYVTSANESSEKDKRLIAVMAQPHFNFNRHRMRNLFHSKLVVPYENNIGNMASKVSQQIVVSKKPLLKYFSGLCSNARKKAAETGDVSANTGDKSLKPVPPTNSRPNSVYTYITTGSTNTADGSSVSVSTKKYGLRSIVPGLSAQTGSSDCSTWV